MIAPTELTPARGALAELAPVLRRATSLDPRSVARIRVADSTAAAFLRLPFQVLVARAIRCHQQLDGIDVTVRAAELLSWLDEETGHPPEPHDELWRSGLPPSGGWRRLDTVPDGVVRELVRSAALALRQAADREGLPDAQPRAEVADAFLDSVVLTVTAEHLPPAEITLRVLSAVTRMGFLPRDSYIAIDVVGRWTRVAAEYGSVFTERAGLSLNLS
ncbi:MAG: hypothetical protein M3N95_09000 [Actinomycetota bacterium]|nr:hypothetical protein [Actinomycetota bacterium]